tara:strand:+ start:11509 stop:12690 length:1182 start_codon:yes stop_codon:yes gene_type:complete
MWIYKQLKNIKTALFILAMAMITSLFIYNQSIINNLRNDSRKTMNLYAELIVKGITEANDVELDFVFSEIIQKVTFPIIQSDTLGNPVIWKNLNDENNLSNKDIKKIILSMNKQNNPIPLEINIQDTKRFKIGYLHYGDSLIVKRLQILPYVQLIGVSLFILLGFIGFEIIRKAEKQNIWFGMARETAHQLGTPVSSLMGWIQRLSDYPKDVNKLIPDMEADVERLNEISRRFSKIGSKPKFELISINKLLVDLTKYFKRRLPKDEIKINLDVQSNNIEIFTSPVLLKWTIENLIKNAIDSIVNKKGFISIIVKLVSKNVIIIINDNGNGISRKDWNNIFRPGFSNKQQGWGIGLSMVKRIVEDFLGGVVKVESSSEKNGTSMKLILPIISKR